MERPLWAPWRISYILGEKEETCLFCRVLEEDRDVDNLVLYRGRLAFVIMNLYPYNPGHLMVAPNRHVSELELLEADEAHEIMDLTQKCVSVLKQTMHPHALNSGFNQGEIAGSSIKEHLHLHIVPRWQGDNNFMPVLADIHVVPQALEETYRMLVPLFS
ncbi:MAG: HIT domain-containing protein [Actinobacteria bacterium]|nr:HIT domain-containing protein [Actinomycetota bacterium]MCL5883578.1 HIT domain-containing protein [Actinomycetota bacterium]